MSARTMDNWTQKGMLSCWEFHPTLDVNYLFTKFVQFCSLYFELNCTTFVLFYLPFNLNLFVCGFTGHSLTYVKAHQFLATFLVELILLFNWAQSIFYTFSIWWQSRQNTERDQICLPHQKVLVVACQWMMAAAPQSYLAVSVSVRNLSSHFAASPLG